MKVLPLILLLAACHPKPRVNPVIQRPGYTYREQDGQVYMMIRSQCVKPDEALFRKAQSETCKPCVIIEDFCARWVILKRLK